MNRRYNTTKMSHIGVKFVFAGQFSHFSHTKISFEVLGADHEGVAEGGAQGPRGHPLPPRALPAAAAKGPSEGVCLRQTRD